MNITLPSNSSSPAVPLPRRRWASRIGLPFGILCGGSGLALWALWSLVVPSTLADGVPVLVRAADPVPGTTLAAPATPAVQAAGWIEPLPFPLQVTALTDGVVEDVLVLEGEEVAANQVVARLVRRDAEIALHQAEAEASRREAAVTGATAAFAQAEAELATLIGPRREARVAAAKAAAAKAALSSFGAEEAMAKATLGELEDEFARKRQLVDSGSVSPQELAKLTFRLEAQRAAVAALPARRAALEAVSEESQAELEAATTALDLRIEEKAKLAMAEAEVKAAEAELAQARAARDAAALRLERTEVRAPVAGRVLARLAAPGSMLSSGPGGEAVVLSLYDPAKLQVRADVPNADMALVGVGMPATVTVEALPNRPIHGTVRLVTGQADIQKNTVQVKIALDDPPQELRPEMLCRVKIGGGGNGSSPSRQQVFAPESLLDGAQAVVAGPVSDGLALAEARQIERGDTVEDGWVAVRSGLRPGDILLDPHLVSPGARVRLRLPNDIATEVSHGVH